MTIEQYTDSRKEEVLKIFSEMYHEMLESIGQRIEMPVVEKFIDKLRHHSFLLIIDGKCVGFLAGIEVDIKMSSQRIFHQVVWYIQKQHRHKSILFFKNVIKTLKQSGFEFAITTLLHKSNLERNESLFKKLGFEPLETHYIKKL